MVAAPHKLVPKVRPSLGEFRFGNWEGMSFEELDTDPDWRRFNTNRGSVRPPGGELMIETQARMVKEIDDLGRQHKGEMVAVVSHGDPLRCLIASYLGAPLDLLLRFEISPASVSVVESREGQPRILCINQTGDIPL
jgi:ribonuclease H / adenosylcobalamin/alpha-ribazole phosphatase